MGPISSRRNRKRNYRNVVFAGSENVKKATGKSFIRALRGKTARTRLLERDILSQDVLWEKKYFKRYQYIISSVERMHWCLTALRHPERRKRILGPRQRRGGFYGDLAWFSTAKTTALFAPFCELPGSFIRRRRRSHGGIGVGRQWTHLLP